MVYFRNTVITCACLCTHIVSLCSYVINFYAGDLIAWVWKYKAFQRFRDCVDRALKVWQVARIFVPSVFLPKQPVSSPCRY